MNTTPSESPFPSDPIRPTEAAQLLRVHVSCVYRWIQKGRLAWWELPGGRMRLSKRDVLELPKPGATPVMVESKEAIALRRIRTEQTLRRFRLA